MSTPALELDKLTVEFPTKRGHIRAVNEVNLKLIQGERLGLVGESGSGKSMTLLTTLRLTPHPGRITQGRVLYTGRDLAGLDPAAMRALRGKDLAMIFQDPMTTMNPVYRVGEQIREALKVHNVYGKKALPWRKQAIRRAEMDRVIELMAEVGIPSPEERYENYPHEFSGGMQQRAVIAIALACNPKVLLADEPTTSLDVTVQAQIMALLERISLERGTSIILVTHDLSLAAEFCDRIAVMYAGSIVELGRVDQVIDQPKHPYTIGLLNALPRLDEARESLQPIPGEIDLAELPPGCAFAPRCLQAVSRCFEKKPRLGFMGDTHLVRCHQQGEAV